MQITPSGRFPIVRAGEHPLRAAVEDWRARGDTSPEAAWQDAGIVAAQEVTTRDLIAAQEAAGVDVLSDGYVPVYDEWFAWAPTVAGVRVGSAIRYLDTNTYYHRWHLDALPRFTGPSPAVAAYARAVALTTRPVKACLFGPYTLWTYAVKEGAAAAPATFDALIEVWVGEVAALAAAGARFVQIEESVLLRRHHRADFPLVARAIQRIAAAVPEVALWLHLACGVVGDLLPPLLDLRGLAGLGLDCTDAYRTPNLAALAGWQGEKGLQVGILDARQIRVETEAELHATLAAVTSAVPASHCIAAPSTALLYLPRHVAFEKLAALASAAHAFVPAEVPA